MTTIVGTRDAMASDRFITYAPSFNGRSKMWIADGCIWGAAGPTGACAAFKQWTLHKGKRPEFKKLFDEEEESTKLEVLQLHPENGLFLWINDDLAEAVAEPFYAIGSGAGYAVGGMSSAEKLAPDMATKDLLTLALETAARWDSATRLPLDIIAVADIPKPKKRRA